MTIGNVIFVVMACVDTSDFDPSHDDYAVCFTFNKRVANAHAKRATAMAATMPRNDYSADDIKALRRANPEMTLLDPYWAPARAGVDPTTYYVTPVGPLLWRKAISGGLTPSTYYAIKAKGRK